MSAPMSAPATHPPDGELANLQLTRAVDESVTITLPDGRRIVVIYNGRAGSSAQARLVFKAPRDVRVMRTELLDREPPRCPRNIHTLRAVGDGSLRCVRCERLFVRRDGMLVESWSSAPAAAAAQPAEVRA